MVNGLRRGPGYPFRVLPLYKSGKLGRVELLSIFVLLPPAGVKSILDAREKKTEGKT